MGLFGSKKEETATKVSDVFSEDDLQQIRDVIGKKLAEGSYPGKYIEMAKKLVEIAQDPQKEYSSKEWGGMGIIFSAGAFSKIEPGLAPALKAAIDRYKSMK